jgi:uncharacterized integral membrane protein
MPWRLIGFILLFGIFLIFIALNLDNRCDIRYWFTEGRVIKDIPVYLTAFASFILGMLCAVPFVFSLRRKKKDKPGKNAGDASGQFLPETSGDPALKKPRKKWGKKKDVPETVLPEETGPYGIN